MGDIELCQYQLLLLAILPMMKLLKELICRFNGNPIDNFSQEELIVSIGLLAQFIETLQDRAYDKVAFDRVIMETINTEYGKIK